MKIQPFSFFISTETTVGAHNPIGDNNICVLSDLHIEFIVQSVQHKQQDEFICIWSMCWNIFHLFLAVPLTRQWSFSLRVQIKNKQTKHSHMLFLSTVLAVSPYHTATWAGVEHAWGSPWGKLTVWLCKAPVSESKDVDQSLAVMVWARPYFWDRDIIACIALRLLSLLCFPPTFSPFPSGHQLPSRLSTLIPGGSPATSTQGVTTIKFYFFW